MPPETVLCMVHLLDISFPFQLSSPHVVSGIDELTLVGPLRSTLVTRRTDLCPPTCGYILQLIHVSGRHRQQE
jgi:hypothetical protein